MLYQIFQFELQQRLRRPETYLYFLVSTLGAMVSVFFIYEDSLGAVQENAPTVLATTLTISYAFLLVIISLIMGMPVLRDFRHGVAGFLYTYPVSKLDYLGGRFLGSLTIAMLVSSGLLWGIILGEHLPWRAPERLLPFHFWSYLQPYLYYVLPTLFFSSALFFVSGALSRKLLVVYTQGILLLVAYLVAMVLLRDGGHTAVGALLDPFSFNTINEVTQYWTPQERNTTLVPLRGLLFYNRLFWAGLGMLLLLAGYRAFSFELTSCSRGARRAEDDVSLKAPASSALLRPEVRFGWRTQWQQRWWSASFHTQMILRETAFWAIVICAAAIILVNSISLGTTYGVDSLPTTYLVIEELQELSGLFFLLILLFFSGEIIWKERDHGLQLVTDALPTTSLTNLAGKLLGLLSIYAILLGTLIGAGILFQYSKGYYQFDLSVYGFYLLLDMLVFLGMYTILSFAAQAISNHKFIGHLLFIVCFLGINSLTPLGLAHPLYTFNFGETGTYSELNGFGPFLQPYFWYKAYWSVLGLVLFMLAAGWIKRGRGSGFRFRGTRKRRPKAQKLILTMGLLAAGGIGSYLFYQVNILAEFTYPATEFAYRADYEKTLRQYAYLPQPTVVKVSTAVDIFPFHRRYSARGTYWLVNKTAAVIPTIHIQEQPARQLVVDTLLLDRPARRDERYQAFGYHIYTLEAALQPGDSLQLQFRQHFEEWGFPITPAIQMVANGTFFRNDHFPTLGYQSRLELRDNDRRRQYGLPEKSAKRPPRDHPHRSKHAVTGDDGYVIEFETVLSTDTSQTALAPGTLLREWQDGDRRYFHYRTNAPTVNFYPFLTGKYAVKREVWSAATHTPVEFEIYHHPDHTLNLERMMRGLHAGMSYCTEAFGPYPYDLLRIVEFPRYESYAQSFPGIIAYSEDLGFLLDISAEDVDIAFFVTVHELAHQWWGLQVAAADVEGRHLLLESLAQYTALMVMKKQYGTQAVEGLLTNERERYRAGRTKERLQELPLARVQSQKYLHYGKGSVNLYALQEYLSEDCVNTALRNFVADWNCFTGPKQRDRYATSADLLSYFRQAAPDSLAYLIPDLFETITFYHNAAYTPTVTPLDDGRYAVAVELELEKIQLDSAGQEHLQQLNDLLPIGLYDERDSLRYLQKHWIKDGQALTLIVDFPAQRLVIDPRQIFLWAD